MFLVVPDLIEELKADETESAPDILAASSQILLDILSEYSNGELPDYFRKLTLEDYFGEKVVEEKKEVITKTNVKKKPKKENKAKRKYLLVKPSSFEKLSKYAEENKDSLNNLIQTLMDQFIEEKGL